MSLVSPVPRQVCQLTCHCGTFIPDAWGPETEFKAYVGFDDAPSFVRAVRCRGCGRTLRWRMSVEGLPHSVTLNPIGIDGIARFDQDPLLPFGEEAS